MVRIPLITMLGRIEVRNAGPRALELLCGLWHRTWWSFATPAAHQAYRMRMLTSPWARRSTRVLVLEEDGKPRSGLILLSFRLRVHRQIRRIAGVAAVVTDPEARGRGLAARLIQITHRRMADSGYDACMLFSEIGTAYYQRLGYHTWPVLRHEVELPPGPGESPWRVRPATGADLASQMQLYRAHQRPFAVALERGRDYWRHLFRRARWRNELAPRPPAGDPASPVLGRFVAQAVRPRRGAPGIGAYARCVVRDGDLSLADAGMAVGREAALRAILVERGQAEGRSLLSVVAPRSLVDRLELPVRSTTAVETMMVAPLRSGSVPLMIDPEDHCFWGEDWF